MALAFKLSSADSHIVEPPDLWTKRIDRKYLDRAPRIVKEDKSDFFVCPGALSEKGGIGLVSTLAKYTKKLDSREFGFVGRWEEVCPGGYDPLARVKEMDEEGIEAEVLYTSFGLTMFSIPDLDFQYACFQAFNDWLANFSAAAPKRLFGAAMLPTEPVERIVSELQRCAKMGLRGAMISIDQDQGRGYDNPMYEPVWSAAEDLGIPLSLHVAASKKHFGHTNNIYADFSLAFTPAMYTIAAMIFSGVFDRHPKLKVISVENDAAWAAGMLERMDDRYERDAGWAGRITAMTSGRKPSQIFHEHVGLSFMRDRTAVFNRTIIGRKNLMWGSDYPHFDGAWPKSKQILASQFEGVSEEDQLMIGRTNLIDFYNLPVKP